MDTDTLTATYDEHEAEQRRLRQRVETALDHLHRVEDELEELLLDLSDGAPLPEPDA